MAQEKRPSFVLSILPFGLNRRRQIVVIYFSPDFPRWVELYLPAVCESNSGGRQKFDVAWLASLFVGNLKHVQEQCSRFVSRITHLNAPGTDGCFFSILCHVIVLRGFFQGMSPGLVAWTASTHDIRIARQERVHEHSRPAGG